MKVNRKSTHTKKAVYPETVKLQFEEFQDYLNIHFKNPTLLYNAFTHSSYVNEHRRKIFTDNERLRVFRRCSIRIIGFPISIFKNTQL